MQDTLRKLLESIGKNMDEADEEQQVGMKIFKALRRRLDQDGISKWLYCEEWEDALIPVRLPKGMVEQLKRADEARTELIADDGCTDCTRKATCTMLKRNPSEILLTFLLKLSFAKMIAEMLMKEVMTDARQNGSDIHPKV